jgi:hypothetical protein
VLFINQPVNDQLTKTKSVAISKPGAGVVENAGTVNTLQENFCCIIYISTK